MKCQIPIPRGGGEKNGFLVKSPNEGPEMDFAVFSLLRLQDRARVSGFENGRTDVFFPSEKEFGQLYFGSLANIARLDGDKGIGERE